MILLSHLVLPMVPLWPWSFTGPLVFSGVTMGSSSSLLWPQWRFISDCKRARCSSSRKPSRIYHTQTHFSLSLYKYIYIYICVRGSFCSCIYMTNISHIHVCNLNIQIYLTTYTFLKILWTQLHDVILQVMLKIWDSRHALEAITKVFGIWTWMGPTTLGTCK